VSPFGDVSILYLVLGVALVSVLVAVIGTWPVCALLLRAYRRRIERGMQLSVTAEPPVTLPPAPPLRPEGAPLRPIAVREIEVAEAHPLLARARLGARRTVVLFCVAGAAYAVAATVAFSLVDPGGWHPLRVVAYLVLIGWPLVPTVLALTQPTRRLTVLVYAGHLVVTLALLGLAGVRLDEVLVVVVVPGVFMLALGARPLRGAAWLVAPGLAVLTAALLALVVPAVYLFYAAPFDVYAWSFLASGIGLLALLAAYVWGLARSYAAKWASDQTLLILQWWLVASLFWPLLLGTQGRVAALLGLAPYGVFLVVLLVGALAGRPAATAPVRLLLLRTFGSRQRSSRLLYDLTRQWRWVGSVELITGPDLASEVLEPDEFLDFLLRRTEQRFVRDPATLPRVLSGLDLRPDRDGRYRVNELLCHSDTWQSAVEGLISAVHAVLMDLRGLTASNAGVVHELELLVARVPLGRVVALVDATTDQQALRWALDRAARLAPPSSPLAADPAPELRVVVLSVGGTDRPERLIAAVAEAAR
jgi:hypothetical protein